MHPLLFKASFEDGTAATIAYLVIGIGLCLILAILHVCMYQQLYSTVAELRSAGHVNMYECLSKVVEAMEDGGPDDEEPTDAATTRRIVRLFKQVKAEDRNVDSGTFMQLVQVCVRTFMLVLSVLYDMKACLEGTKSGFRELLPSLVFISYLALADRVLHTCTSEPAGSRWRILALILSVLLGLAYCGGVVITVVFYIAAKSSDLLSDTRQTFLNVVLVGLLMLDTALHVVSLCLLLLPHRETAVVEYAASDGAHESADEGGDDEEARAEEENSSGESRAEEEARSPDDAAPKATALGSNIRVLRVQGLDGDKTTTFKQVDAGMTSGISGIIGHLKTGSTALEMRQANKKNK
jgi:hypothetical protein